MHFSLNYDKLYKFHSDELLLSNISFANSLSYVYILPTLKLLLNSPFEGIELTENVSQLRGKYSIINELIIEKDKKIEFNYANVTTYVVNHSIEKILEILYTPQHIRVYRYLQKTFSSNLNAISLHCSIKPKACEKILSDLVKERLITFNMEIKEYVLCQMNECLMNYLKNYLYEMIYKVKIDLIDKLKSLSVRISVQMQEEYITKGYSVVNSLVEIILSLELYLKHNMKKFGK